MTDLRGDLAQFKPRELKFINCYMVNGSAAESYKLAGYKAANSQTAAACGSRLLARPAIRREINRRLQRMDVAPEEILTELAKMIIQDGEDEFKWSHKLKAAELAMKHKKMLGDSGTGTQHIETQNILQVLASPQGAIAARVAAEEDGPPEDPDPIDADTAE